MIIIIMKEHLILDAYFSKSCYKTIKKVTAGWLSRNRAIMLL